MGSFSPIQIPCNGTNLTLRSARKEDAALLIELAREIYLTSPHTLTTAAEFAYTIEQEAALIDTFAQRDNSLFLVAFNGDAPLGSLIIRGGEKIKDRHSCLLGIGIRSSSRGKGIGTVLMQAAIQWATDHDVLEMIKLTVYASNTKALELYRRLDFVQCGMLPGGCRHSDGSYHDQIDMYRWVKPGH